MNSGVATPRCPHGRPSSLKFSGMWSNRCHSLYSRWRPSSTSVNEKNPSFTLLATSGECPEIGDCVDIGGVARTGHLGHEVGVVAHEDTGALVPRRRQPRPTC